MASGLIGAVLLSGCIGQTQEFSAPPAAAPTAASGAADRAPVATPTAQATPAMSVSPVVVGEQGGSSAATPRTVVSASSSPSLARTASPPLGQQDPPPGATEEPLPALTPTPIYDPTAFSLVLLPVATGLNGPVGMANAGDGSGRLFVIEQQGRIQIVQGGAVLPTPFLDIVPLVRSSGNEQGLLGIAFHPNYRENGFFFVHYSDLNGDTMIARYQVSADPNLADPGTATTILQVDQPYSNHNGGHLAFGPDGYLWIGMGDGGSGGDPQGYGQNPAALLGKMLRLDVDSALPYAIPADNPFVNSPGFRGEIWSVGLRNPWRYSFDRLSGDLYIADVGQNSIEEVNFQPLGERGQNYGWNLMEGSQCFRADTCDSDGLVKPIAEYDHSQGCSVTGGFVYRGPTQTALWGAYFFADYCSGLIWSSARDQNGDWVTTLLLESNLNVSSFGEDEAGEVYLIDNGGGTLYQLAASKRG